MNHRTISTAVITASLALPVGLLGQAGTSPAQTPGQPQTQQQDDFQRDRQFGQEQDRLDRDRDRLGQDQWGQDRHHAKGEIRRVSSEELDRKVTARQILDMAIYDMEGNRIGEVSDFALGDALPSEIAQRIEAGGTTGMTGGIGAGARGGQVSGEVGVDDRGQLEADATVGIGAQQDQAELTVFVRVGGTLGIGGQTVAIPISQLEYDAAEERFTVSLSQEEINAIAEGREAPGALDLSRL